MRMADAGAALPMPAPMPMPAASVTSNAESVMQISGRIKASNGLVQFAPNGAYIASANGTRLVVRDAQSLTIVQQFLAVDVIQAIAWSDDSELILTAMYKRALVQVWSVVDASWSCKITEGVAGMIFATFAPSSREVLAVSDFQLHATIWSLIDSSKSLIRHPKGGADAVAFSPDARYLAMLERESSKDCVGIYSCESWELVTHFTSASYDAAQLAWSPDNSTLAIRDASLEYRVLLYASNGAHLATYQAYEHALGLRCMTWSSSGQFLALGSYDDQVRVLSHLNWKPIAEFDHMALAVQVSRVTRAALEYEQHYVDEHITDRPQGRRIMMPARRAGASSSAASAAWAAAQTVGGHRPREICFVVREPPFSVITVASDPMKGDPKIGVSRAVWSADASLLATKCEQMPHNLWIWQTTAMRLQATVSFIANIKAFAWSPTDNRLAIAAGDHRVYLWTVEGITWIEFPVEDFRTLGLRWHPDGQILLAVGKTDYIATPV